MHSRARSTAFLMRETRKSLCRACRSAGVASRAMGPSCPRRSAAIQQISSLESSRAFTRTWRTKGSLRSIFQRAMAASTRTAEASSQRLVWINAATAGRPSEPKSPREIAEWKRTTSISLWRASTSAATCVAGCGPARSNARIASLRTWSSPSCKAASDKPSRNAGSTRRISSAISPRAVMALQRIVRSGSFNRESRLGTADNGGDVPIRVAWARGRSKGLSWLRASSQFAIGSCCCKSAMPCFEGVIIRHFL